MQLSAGKIAVGAAVVLVVAPGTRVWAQADVLPPIPKGTIAAYLQPVATGMAAPDYAISPPGERASADHSERQFVARIGAGHSEPRAAAA